MTRLIERNTTIPTSKSQVFSTAADSQPSVEIHVLQGERDFTNDNKTLGRFILDGIPPAPRGVPQVEVSFDLDANGILSVKAKDKATGKEQKITITASSGLSKDEIEKMKKDAELNAEADKQKRELVELKNNAETMIYTTEKMLKEYGEKVAADKKKSVEEKMEALKKVKDGTDKEAIKKAADELATIAQEVGGEMYKQAQAEQAAQPQAGKDHAANSGEAPKADDKGPIDA
jgi:molecular chaperone DnaK